MGRSDYVMGAGGGGGRATRCDDVGEEPGQGTLSV